MRELMPPTRGHDLKLGGALLEGQGARMPPTRGHDLKPAELPARWR